MTLQYVREQFKECPACEAKPGSPSLCHECLERREMYGLLTFARKSLYSGLLPTYHSFIPCPTCNGNPNPKCEEHGR